MKILNNMIRITMKDFTDNKFAYGVTIKGTLTLNTSIINIVLNNDVLKLSGVNIDQNISIDWVECNYGSVRPYFICPDCGSRISALYYINNGFSCRKCNKLIYKSQTESKFSRLMNKARKIECKINPHSYSIIDKPKGMHLKTYNRLVDQYDQLARKIKDRLSDTQGGGVWF